MRTPLLGYAMDETQKGKMLKDVWEHMATIDEVALVVLKGHLLIEESLGRIISWFVFHADKLDSARLSFAQQVWIARSMSLDEADNTMWDLILAINGLRNDLAHNLHSEKRKSRVERVLSLYNAETRDLRSDERATETEEQHVVLSYAIGLCLGFLSAFEAEVERFKEWLERLDRVVNRHRHRAGNEKPTSKSG